MSWFALAAALSFATPDARIVVRWEAPPECPDADGVRQRIDALLVASAVDIGDAAPMRVVGRVASTADGYALELEMTDDAATRERRIAAASCDELAHAAAVIVAIAIDPSAATVGPLAPVFPPPQPQPEPQPPPVTEAPPAITPRAQVTMSRADRPTPATDRPAFAMVIGAGVDALLLRPAGATLVGGVALFGALYRIELLARYAAPSTPPVATTRRFDTRVQSWALGIGGCLGPRIGPRERGQLSMCGGFEAGAIRARGVGADLVGRASSAPWVAVTIGSRVAWSVHRRIALWLGAEGVVMLGRPRFVTDEGTFILRPGRVGLRGLAGFDLRFGGQAK